MCKKYTLEMKWCILHVPLSSFLLSSGAFPAPVNNEGDTPVDLAEDENIMDMIKQQIAKLGLYGGVCGGGCA